MRFDETITLELISAFSAKNKKNEDLGFTNLFSHLSTTFNTLSF